MTSKDELVELERAGWDVLSAGGDAAASHYAEVLASEVLFSSQAGWSSTTALR